MKTVQLSEGFLGKNWHNYQEIRSDILSFFNYNHHGAEISVISLVERNAIKLLILICY